MISTRKQHTNSDHFSYTASNWSGLNIFLISQSQNGLWNTAILCNPIRHHIRFYSRLECTESARQKQADIVNCSKQYSIIKVATIQAKVFCLVQLLVRVTVHPTLMIFHVDRLTVYMCSFRQHHFNPQVFLALQSKGQAQKSCETLDPHLWLLLDIKPHINYNGSNKKKISMATEEMNAKGRIWTGIKGNGNNCKSYRENDAIRKIMKCSESEKSESFRSFKCSFYILFQTNL